jgi:pSer/pThr/pTyr-binding forkhead associated (FHA) protein
VLRQGTREFRIDRPVLNVGRSTSCEVQVMSGLVSRRHARISATALGVSIEDLGSRNGVYVNSERVIGSVLLKDGDRLAIGDEVLVFCEVEETVVDPDAETGVTAIPGVRARRDGRDEENSVATRNADIFQALSGVVDRALALGRGDEAENLIGGHLEAALADVLAGRHLAADIARSAAGYAVRLGGATNRAEWLNYAVQLYRALGLVLPLALVDEMYVLLRRVRGIDPNELGRYTEQLRARMTKLAPAERFVLQRLLGLERLAAWQNSR